MLGQPESHNSSTPECNKIISATYVHVTNKFADIYTFLKLLNIFLFLANFSPTILPIYYY